MTCDKCKIVPKMVGEDVQLRVGYAVELCPLHAAAGEMRKLIDGFDNWFNGWCPSHRCCASSGKHLHDAAVALLARTEPTP